MYFIRADGNAEIGIGHLMRCLTIAEALTRQLHGEQPVFVCAAKESAAFVRDKGFKAYVLGTDFRSMEEELPGFTRLLQQTKDNVILADSYYVTERYLKELADFGWVILLDDMQQKSYPVHMVINYNAFARQEEYVRLYQGKETICLTGSDYVPIRQQFLGLSYQVSDEVKNILITTGGGDSENIAGRIAKAIYRKGRSLHLIAGRFFPHREELCCWAKMHEGVYVYQDVQDMAEMMQRCDLAVTAGGTTIYEMAAVGLPFICFSYAENQDRLTRYIGEREIAAYAGAYQLTQEETIAEISRLTDLLSDDRQRRMLYCQRERGMIDGHGAARIAAEAVKCQRRQETGKNEADI